MNNENVQWYKTIAQPESDNVRIWRYMDMARFVSLLENRALYFCRADLLGDPFEASVPRKNLDIAREVAARSSFRDEHVANHRSVGKNLRKFLFVSCWHESDVESDAMWKLYGRDDRAIAITSTYGKLKSLHDVLSGRVTYIDYDVDEVPSPVATVLSMYKRASFSHEKEVRGIIWNVPDSETGTLPTDHSNTGVQVEVDLNGFIDDVYVAPTCLDWYRELVQKLMVRYNIESELKHSTLESEPEFFGMGIGARRLLGSTERSK